jgi:flagellar hook-length control protein FliK
MTVTAPIPVLGPAPATAGQQSPPSGLDAVFGSTPAFKTAFDSAIASLKNDGTAKTGAPKNLDALQSDLQKKISDMLAQGMSLSEIVNQLATTLASQFAGAFAGDPTQIRAQLQAAFASALAPPGTGPPVSIADSASALAQRFRQVAEAAAGVSGETGQSNRLFAGSNSDAATTAGVAPAPNLTNGPGPTTADSTLSGANTGTASLTAPLAGDGKSVAFAQLAPALGSNGETPIGRVLARAILAQQAATPNPTALAGLPVPVQPVPALLPTQTTASVAAALIAATNGNPSDAPGSATGSPAALSPALTAFLGSFSSALAVADGTPTVPLPKSSNGDGSSSNALLAVPASSLNAPTISAFMPVQAPFSIDALNANAPQFVPPTASQPAVDPNSVVDQVLRGAFLRTDGTTSHVRLSLVPENLGDVSVRLTVNGGTVSAQILAQTPAAHDALLAGQSQLTRSLADAGLKLTSFNVSLAGGFTSFQQQQQQSTANPQSSGRRMLIGGIDSVASVDDDPALMAMPTFGPPILANANAGSLNYLV